jgi:hypothetical protein
VRARRVAAASVASVGLTALAAWIFEWSFEKAVYLAPVIVVCVGAAAAVVVLWTRVIWESLRGQRHRGRIIAIAVALLALLAALSLLGLKLPRE